MGIRRTRAQVLKSNQQFAATIAFQMSGQVRMARNFVAIKMFQAAVAGTYQDSGQFAYNWHISWSEADREFLPEGTAGRRYVSGSKAPRPSLLGYTGDARSKGAADQEVIKYVLKKYGLGTDMSARPETTDAWSRQGKLFGRSPVIVIYNPMYDKTQTMGSWSTPARTFAAHHEYAAEAVPSESSSGVDKVHVPKLLVAVRDAAVAEAHKKIASGAWRRQLMSTRMKSAFNSFINFMYKKIGGG